MSLEDKGELKDRGLTLCFPGLAGKGRRSSDFSGRGMWDCAYVPQFPDCFRLGCTVPAASPEQTFCDGSHRTCGFSHTVEARELAPAKPKL